MKRIIFALFLCFVQSAHGQLARDIKEHKITSKVMGEQLSLYVQLPTFYEENSDYKYPVLFILDAPIGMTTASGILDPLVGYNQAPQMIIVGLATNNRERDFTPFSDGTAGADIGGANKYLNYIEKEAIPLIEKTYRTEEFRIFSGHSYGGLLVVHSIYSKPDLFNAYFAFSPSLYWNNRKPADALISFLRGTNDFNRYLYLNIGNEGNPEIDSPKGKEMLRAIQSVERALCVAEPDGFRHKIDYYRQEPHQVTQIIGAYQALRSLYPAWDIPPEKYSSGYDAVTSHFNELSEIYGYKIEAKDWQLYDAAIYQLHEKNNPHEAIRFITTALQKHPQDTEYMSVLALAYQEARQYPQAIKTLEDIILQLDKNDAQRVEMIKKLNAVKTLQSKN